ncbi:MAG: hypothetical protein RQ968_04865, partial [Thermoproteota archaeon]|nr:hypothetical protein [Thermoproteota archaeon]
MEIYNYIESKKEITLNDNIIFIKRLEINRLYLGNYLLTIALYSSLKEFKENINKEKTNFEIISEYFPKLYKSKKTGLGLNVRLLKRDLEEIECVVESAKSKGISLKEYVLLKDLYQNKTEGKKCDKRGDQKRNFFAHSGLEKTLTYVKVNE